MQIHRTAIKHVFLLNDFVLTVFAKRVNTMPNAYQSHEPI